MNQVEMCYEGQQWQAYKFEDRELIIWISIVV